MDLLQLMHELEKRGTGNGLVCAVQYPVNVKLQDEQDRESGEWQGGG